MLKPLALVVFGVTAYQPPSGGCVLKHSAGCRTHLDALQPPSGGCVLKPGMKTDVEQGYWFSRLQAAVC